MLQSFFFVPSESDTALGTLTWGVGPAVTWPTSTDQLLGAGTLGLGPTGVFLFQDDSWTYGMLINHQWGTAETRTNAPTINNTFFQPFLSYNTPSAWTFSLNTEGSYNWSASDFAVPINATVGKVLDIAGQKTQLTAGLRYWANSADDGPEGFGARLQMTFLFPK